MNKRNTDRGSVAIAIVGVDELTASPSTDGIRSGSKLHTFATSTTGRGTIGPTTSGGPSGSDIRKLRKVAAMEMASV